MRAGVNHADDHAHFRNVIRLEPIFKGRIEAFRGRLLDNHRLRRRKLDVGNGGDLGHWRLWRRDEGNEYLLSG